MVGSIWLTFDPQFINDPQTIQFIKDTIKDKYKSYSYMSQQQTNTMIFNIIDYAKIMEIIERLSLEIDDTARCDCGCMSTDLERAVHFTQIEFSYGQIDPAISYKYFKIGRSITLSVDPYNERFYIIRYILEDLKKVFDRHKLDSNLELGDAGSVFDNVDETLWELLFHKKRR